MPEFKSATVYQVTADDLTALIQEAVSNAMTGLIVQPKPEPSEKYITGAEVQKMLHISEMTLYNWKSAGKIKSYKINRRVLFREDEIKDALTAQVPLKYKRMKHGGF